MVLDEPIPLEGIPVRWRIEEGGPFNSGGAVNQAYMFPLSTDFVPKLASLFPEIELALGVEPAPDLVRRPTVTDLADIARAVRAEGLRIDDRTLRRFHLSLQTRGFVILSGISGTGKSWLAEAYARAVRGELALVPVAPNWNTNEDLLGYLNPIDSNYHDTNFSRFVRAAAAEWLRERPAVEHSHAHVQHDQRGQLIVEGRQRLAAVLRHARVVALVLEHLGDQPQDRRVIFDDEDVR